MEAKTQTVYITALSEADDLLAPARESNGSGACTRPEFGPIQTVVHLINSQCDRMPNGVAIEDEYGISTYGDLAKRTNKLARYLRKRGVEKEDLVAISVGRSSALIVGLLGILKAGAAYVPMDPEY